MYYIIHYLFYLIFTLTYQSQLLPSQPPSIIDPDKISDGRNPKFVVYWGQNSYGAAHPNNKEKWEKPLREYCVDDNIDIFVVSFLNIFNVNNDKPPELNLSYHCNTTFEEAPNLLRCPKIEEDIQFCQSKGKKVLLSLGGAAGSYGFNDLTQPFKFAKTLWDMFLGGQSKLRPFGKAILDGVDLDIEGGSSLGYTELVNSLRELYVKSPFKRFYMGAAPQCVFPDAFLGPALNQAHFDYVFVQFYNNYCGVQAFSNPYGFNFPIWEQWARETSINPRVKLFLGVPGSATAASNGYLSPESLLPIIKNISSYKSFGGVMAWDASQASNEVDIKTPSFTQRINDILKSILLVKEEDKKIKDISKIDNQLKNNTYSIRNPYQVSDSLLSLDLVGKPCNDRSIGCLDEGYLVCTQGIWVLGECPVDTKCIPSYMKLGHFCIPTKYNNDNDNNIKVSNNYHYYDSYYNDDNQAYQIQLNRLYENFETSQIHLLIKIHSLINNQPLPNPLKVNLLSKDYKILQSDQYYLINNNQLVLDNKISMATTFKIIIESSNNNTRSNFPFNINANMFTLL